MDNPPN